MYYLLIDTCVWIDLCRRFTKVLRKINDLVEGRRVTLILPQTIIDEWERNKETKIISPWKDSVRSKLKNAKDILEFLEQGQSAVLRMSIDELQNREDVLLGPAREAIVIAELLFEHQSTIRLVITNEAKLQAVDYALTMKAPFQKKNSMADALILFSFIKHAQKEGLANCFFISSNTNDFAAATNRAEIHPDLKQLFDEGGLRYFSNIGLAVNEIETGLLEDEQIEEIAVVQSLEESYRLIRLALQPPPTLMRALQDSMKPSPAVMEAVRAATSLNSALVNMQELLAVDPAVLETIRTAIQIDPVFMRALQDSMKPSPAVKEAVRAATSLNSALVNMQELLAVDPAVLETIRTAIQIDPVFMRALQDSMKPSPVVMEAMRLVKVVQPAALEAFRDFEEKGILASRSSTLMDIESRADYEEEE